MTAQLFKKTLFSLVVAASLIGCGSSSNSNNETNTTQPPITTKPDTGVAGDQRLDEVIEYYRKEANLPAVNVLSLKDGTILESSSVGTYHVNSATAVTGSEHWHIGSMTKSMTALLVARLVDAGLTSWESTLRDVFPDMAMLPHYETATFKSLLSHTAGIPEDEPETWEDWIGDERSVETLRLEVTTMALSYDESDSVVGEGTYSNINYVIVAAMCEKITGSSFETLMQNYVFDPLNMTETRLSIAEQATSIWGHLPNGSSWKPMDPTLHGEPTLALLAPAGSRTYTTNTDMAKYLQTMLDLTRNQSDFLTETSTLALFTPVATVFDIPMALGWMAQEDHFFHNGSNGHWQSSMMIFPNANQAYYIVTNAPVGEDQAEAFFKLYEILQTRANPSE